MVLAVAGILGVAVAIFAGAWLWRSHRAPKLTEKDTVVLADFSNTTGDAVFDDTLKTALNISLRQSPFLNVLSDSEVTKTLQQMTRPANTKLTREVTRELCQRAGKKAYIEGSIGSLGSQYVLGLKAANCQNGDTLAEEQATAASKEKVLDVLGKEASKLRARVGRIPGYGAEVRRSARAGHHVFARSSESLQPWTKGHPRQRPRCGPALRSTCHRA